MSLLINYRLYLLVSFCGVKSSETGDVIGKQSHATPLLISLLVSCDGKFNCCSNTKMFYTIVCFQLQGRCQRRKYMSVMQSGGQMFGHVVYDDRFYFTLLNS